MVLAEHKAFIEPVLELLSSSGLEYFCAAKDENWMLTQKDPTAEFKRDLDEIYSSDIMLALLEETVSAGVQIEIGCMLREIAEHPEKRLVLAHPRGIPLAWSNNAISKLPGVSSIEYETPKQIVDFIR